MLGTQNVDSKTVPHGADISGTRFAQEARKLIALITSLRALGAQADFDLPRIAVIGNQSAGKSSLIEAISGITLPRASGTCTRCPMECRLTHSSGPWQCQVLLRRETDEHGRKIPTKEEKFGPLLHDKSELEEMIRRAQLAILNPSVPKDVFETFDTKSLKQGEKPAESIKQLAFSSNVVCLDLSAPDVTDLSFIDLPGIISNVASGEDRGNIEAVRNMVAEHIKGNTLILLTITMRDDIDNQGAAHLAQLEDEKGSRTIGVLTKPDLIQRGEEAIWISVLEGRSHPLKYGYYITKQRNPTELEDGLSLEHARLREEQFFETEQPWSSKPELRDRMGTPNLTRELSRLLGNVIRKALPKLRQEAKESQAQIKAQLDELPPPPSENPTAELLRLVTAFASEANALIQGAESHERLIQRCRPVYKAFKHDIRKTAPRFRPYENEQIVDNLFDFTEIVVDSDTDAASDPSLDDSPATAPMYLEDVRAHIHKSLTRQLPYNTPFVAKVALIETFFIDWDEYSQKCFSAVYEAAQYELRLLADKHFGGYGGTPLLEHVRTIVEEQIERSRAKTLDRIQWMLELENPPFTNNDHYFSSYRDKYLVKYKKARAPNGGRADPEDISELQGLLARLGYPSDEHALARLHGPDKYEEELIVMAETSAYFHVSYKRIIDNIPRVIDHDFLRSIANELQDSLINGLALGSENAAERASTYLMEDPEVSTTRTLLTQKNERLKAVLKKLYDFQV